MIIRKGDSVSKNIHFLTLSRNYTRVCSIVLKRIPSIAIFLSDEYVSDYLL